MAQRRISIAEITIGAPLPWDVFDEKGQLLLSKGFVVGSAKQVESLVERGLFAETASAGNARTSDSPAAKQTEPPSVLRLLNAANMRLERLLFGLQNEPDFPAKLLDIAKVVIFATDLNPNIATACVLLNQHAEYPARHCIDTAMISILIARSLKFSQEETLKLVAGCLTMNIGMIHYYKQLQSRQALTAEETARIRQHPQEGVKMLEGVGVTDSDWLEYVLSHHENEDGTGYPHGKAGKDIPQPAKIISLADIYCARVSARDYRKSVLPNIALRDIFLERGKGIDAILAATFIKELGIYPPGTFVRLTNGEIGVVSQKGETATTPAVHALIGPRGAPLSFAIKRDTAKELFAIRDALSQEAAAIRFSMQQVWGNQATL